MHARWIVPAGVLLLLTACATTKSNPTGIILVGTPEVSTRERLVNDRLTQDRWLREQLTEADGVTFDDFQGLLDERTLTALSINATINADPNKLAISGAESANRLQSLEQANELADLDHQIQVLEKQKRLEELRSGTTTQTTVPATPAPTTPAPTTPTTPTTPTPTTPANTTPATDPVGALITRLASNQRASLPDPNAIGTTKAKSSPIEALHDKLAYREEIRNEILENQLDDRHDLRGNTLYRLNIDSTLIPSASNNSWAVVDVAVEAFDDRPTEDLYEEWVRSFRLRFEREVASQFMRMRGCLGDLTDPASAETACGLGIREMEDLLAYARQTRGKYAERSDFRKMESTYEQQVKADFRDEIYASVKPGERNDRKLLETALEYLVAKKVTSDYFELYHLDQYLDPPAISGDQCAPDSRRVRSVGMVNWCSPTLQYTKQKYNTPEYFCASARHDAEKAAGEPERDIREIRFECALESAWHIYAYSATPKDSVQRISRVAATRNTLELAAALSALTGAASLDAATAFVRDNQRLMQSILREPLVVGYTEGGDDPKDMYERPLKPNKARFGWLIGPRFGLQPQAFMRREAINMDHRPIQNAHAAAISIPGWSRRAKVTVTTCWKSKQSIQGTSSNRCQAPDILDKRDHYIELPGRIEAIHDLLITRSNPATIGLAEYEVVAGAPAALLIKGTNLWRSTEVTLGAQTADEIRVLPDMAGIIARFKTVEEPAGLDGNSSRLVEVNIWTSGGNQQAGQARIYPAKRTEVPWKLAWRQPRAVKDEEIAVQLLQGNLPPSFGKMELVVEGYDASKAAWTEPIRLNATARGNVATAKLSDVTKLLNGMELRGGVWVFLRPDSAAVDLKAATEGNAVYYATAGDGKIQPSANIKSGNKLTITFPKRVAQAFPGYTRPSLTLSTLPAAAQLTLTNTTPVWKPTADGQEVLETTVTITGNVAGATNPKLVLALSPLPDGLVLEPGEIPIVP
jgi:hypothetical protein